MTRGDWLFLVSLFPLMGVVVFCLVRVVFRMETVVEIAPVPTLPLSAPPGRTMIKTGRMGFFLGGDRDPSDQTRMV